MTESLNNTFSRKRKEKQNQMLRIAITGLTLLALCFLFFPVVRYHFQDTVYVLNGLALITSNLLVLGQLIVIPFLLRAALILAALCPLAGLVLVWKRKAEWAGIFYILAALFVLIFPLLSASVEQSAYSLGVDTANVQLQIGYSLPFASLIFAAVCSLLTRSGEKLAQSVLLVLACVSVGCVFFITLYMILEGTPAVAKIGIIDFLFNQVWEPTAATPSFGIANMILASVAGTLGSITIGVPIGLLTAIFLAELAPKWMVRIVRPAVELLAGIPSVIYGFFGMQVIVPFLRRLFPEQTTGESLLAVIIILSIMILPTIISVAEGALKSVPSSYKEASLALGNTHIGTIFKVLVPAAKSGILAGVILGVGRAIGETMAIIMVAGNMVNPPSLFGSVRPLTSGIAFEMGYATGLHRQALFAIGLVLFVFIMIINITFTYISKKGVQMNEK